MACARCLTAAFARPPRRAFALSVAASLADTIVTAAGAGRARAADLAADLAAEKTRCQSLHILHCPRATIMAFEWAHTPLAAAAS